MTVTDQQLRALTFLAKACRPNGSRRWDEAGIAAALEKVRDRDLGELIVATIKAATDRDAETPGVIPANGSHWQQAAVVSTATRPRYDESDTCSTCSYSEAVCQSRWPDDHPFVSVAQARALKGHTDVHRTVAALKDELAPVAPPQPRTTLDDLEARNPALKARLDQLRADVPGVRAGAGEVAG